MSLGERVVSLFGNAPRYAEVYDLLSRAGENVALITARLDDLMREWPEVSPERRVEIVDLEHEGDRITHDLIKHLFQKASTPIEAQDAHRLASQVDDIVDLSEEMADFLWLYKVEAPTDHAIELTGIFAIGRRRGGKRALQAPQTGRAPAASC